MNTYMIVRIPQPEGGHHFGICPLEYRRPHREFDSDRADESGNWIIVDEWDRWHVVDDGAGQGYSLEVAKMQAQRYEFAGGE